MSVNNTNYGLNSLKKNSGQDNTAIGAYAAYNSIDTSYNTCVGSNSLFYNTTGSNNTAIGAGSICNNTIGKLNTALGSSALEGVITDPSGLPQSVGNQNVAVGVTTLFNNTGNLNTALGAYSGLAHTDGSANTFLGANTDVSDNTITYANSTALGYNAKIGASNQIKMGGLNAAGDYPDVLIPGTAHFEQYTPGEYDNLSIVPKSYIDALASGLQPVGPVVAATTGENINGTYSNAGLGSISGLTTPLTIDGVLIQDGSAVLIKDQTNNIQNGIYIQSPNTLTRRLNMSTGLNAQGDFVFVTDGTVNERTSWVASNPNSTTTPKTAIVGTEPIVFTIFNDINFKLGQGLYASSSGGYNYLNVDSSLNFIQYLDNTAGPSPGTMYVGTNTTNINVGKSNSITSVNGNVRISSTSTITSSGEIFKITNTNSGVTELKINPGLYGDAVNANFVTYDCNGTAADCTHFFWDNVMVYKQLSLVNPGFGITFPDNKIQTTAFTGWGTAATYTYASITIDGNGRITGLSSGTAPSTPGLEAVLTANNSAGTKSINMNTQNISGVGTCTATTFSGTTFSGTTFTASGTCSAVTFNATSDYRIKENIQLLNDTYNIDNLKPSTYFNTKSGKQDIGLIAHELQEIYPELVTGEKDGKELQSINYIGLIPILIKEIQDLKKEIKSTFKGSCLRL